MSKIDSFTGANRFLSNFYSCRVVYEGLDYPSSEHAFQAAKTTDWRVRTDIAALRTSGEAKRVGRKLDLRCDWEVVKLHVMYEIVGLKFQQNPELARRLLATGDDDLIEGNTWNDTFWGVCRGTGHNHLGRILMVVRHQIAVEE